MSYVKAQGVHGETEGPEQLTFQVSASSNKWAFTSELTICFILYEDVQKAVLLYSRIASMKVCTNVGSNCETGDQTNTW